MRDLGSCSEELFNLTQLAEVASLESSRHENAICGQGQRTGVPRVCNDCGRCYSTASNLARHRQTHRAACCERQCGHCGKPYVSLPALSMHLRTHTRAYECSFCGKCFSRPWLLQGHIRTHTGEKPYKCGVCFKAFADKSNVRAHEQTHSRVKPYVCLRCGKAFALKSYLSKHDDSSCLKNNSVDSQNSPIDYSKGTWKKNPSNQTIT